MILLLIMLLSLSSIYFTRLFLKKEMTIAAVTVAVLYIYLILWTYLMFIMDIANLGFNESETTLSLIHGSIIYHSFVDITARMSVIPLPFLEAIVLVSIFVLITGFAAAFHGLFQITKQICKYVRESLKKTYRARILNILIPETPQYTISILRMNCRANC